MSSLDTSHIDVSNDFKRQSMRNVRVISRSMRYRMLRERARDATINSRDVARRVEAD